MGLLCVEHGTPDTLESMHPGYFALVMATGIVAITLQQHDILVLPIVLFCFNTLFLVTLVVATLTRVYRYPAAFLADIRSHKRGMGFFTMVSATGVYGSQIMLQFHAPMVALPFWILTCALWFVVTYGILTALTTVQEKPNLSQGLNGSWLVAVVATQSLSILTTLVLVAPVFESLHLAMVFTALILWLGGGALYTWLMTLIFFRYTFWSMPAQDYTPPYWINMGAVAISTLAGITLLQHAPASPMIRELAPFIKGLTLMYWAVGSWWIPMLLLLGIWRYFICRVPVAYDPLYWGGVFPLGMYAACTHRLADMMQTPFLLPLSYGFAILAVVAWLAAFIGLVDSRLNKQSRASPS